MKYSRLKTVQDGVAWHGRKSGCVLMDIVIAWPERFSGHSATDQGLLNGPYSSDYRQRPKDQETDKVLGQAPGRQGLLTKTGREIDPEIKTLKSCWGG